MLLASYNLEEGDMRAHYLDRFACTLNTDEHFASEDDRLEAVHLALKFQV